MLRQIQNNRSFLKGEGAYMRRPHVAGRDGKAASLPGVRNIASSLPESRPTVPGVKPLGEGSWGGYRLSTSRKPASSGYRGYNDYDAAFGCHGSTEYGMSGFADFGLDYTDNVKANDNATITLDFSYHVLGIPIQLFQSTVFNDVKSRFDASGLGSVVKVDRAFGSGRWAITFIPNVVQPVSYWVDVFTSILNDAKYSNVQYVAMDAGVESSEPGGLVESAGAAVGGVAKTAGTAVGAAFKGAAQGLGAPMTIGLLALGGLILYSYFRKPANG